MAVDAQQRVCRFVAGGWGIIFVIRADGEVQWWYHTGGFTGAGTWANGGVPRVIDTDWHEFVEVLGSDNGVMWGIYADGRVMRYRYVTNDLNTGAGSWDNGGVGVQIGTGFNQFTRWFGGPSGVLWCVDAAGGLWRSDYVNGALTTPAKVGSGFDDADWLGADLDGVIYAVRLTELYWFKHSLTTGWANGGTPIRIAGTEWDDRVHTAILADAGGMFYAVAPSKDLTVSAGDLLWNRLNNYATVATDGSAHWASTTAKTIGSGFTVEPRAPLQGYVQPVSATPGQTVGVRVSSTFPSYSASVWRLDVAAGPVQVQAPQTMTGALQTLVTGPVPNGCGWQPTFNVPVSASWASGVYSARLDGPYGMVRHVPFVVRPAAPTATLAVLMPTLTYEAYNSWGGHSAYSNCPTTAQVTLCSRRPSRTMTPDGDLSLDLLLLRWLNGQGLSYDVHADQDLHNDLDLLKPYRAVMLGAHPEYWTGAMRQALALYLRGGGRLIYPGGNGLYESCELSADAGTGIWRASNGNRYIYRDRMLPETQLLGVGWDSRGWMTFAPYKVLRDHPILANTGLTVGSTFGAATASTRAASGIEFDMISTMDGSATSADVIAQGQNGPDFGAQMVLLDRPGGGKVFSAGSIAFATALPVDAAMSTLFRNVVDLMLATN